MNATENKRIIQAIHAELAKGNGRPFVDSLAEDVSWTLKGRTSWSRTYQGRKAVQEELLDPLFAQFEQPYIGILERLTAEDDTVVAQWRGDVLTRSGKRYGNDYCYVYRLAGGRIVDIVEYFDTALVDEMLEAPIRAG